MYTDYEALVADPDVDAVYIATTHNFHHENIRLCLKNGKHVLSSSFTHNAPTEGIICGTQGYIRVPGFLWAHEFHIHLEGQDEPETIHLPYAEGENFRFEIAHAMQCIEAGKLERDIMPLSETLAVMQTMDTLPAQWGLKYEGESINGTSINF